MPPNDEHKAKHLEEESKDFRILMHLKYLDNCKQDDIIELQPPLSDTPNLPENNDLTLFKTKNNFNPILLGSRLPPILLGGISPPPPTRVLKNGIKQVMQTSIS